MNLREEIARRRTFAIISHPDAGKTTLTEKLLLYGGSLHLAGSVSARKNQRSTTSDWMELEKKRGISISSTVLQFEYDGYYINLLDTPGHKDFSEDTYRVLTAVDAAVMVIDAGKGIESQTRKLFEVCARRKVPIFTFMNKLDRPTREPLELLDELEKVLGISSFAVNWPLGTGSDFQGVYDRLSSQVHLFERTPGGAFRAPVAITDISDPTVKDRLSSQIYSATVEELELLAGIGAGFDTAAVLSGKLTPVFFGSASNNFGVQLLLDSFLKYSAAPAAHVSGDRVVAPDNEAFSAFVFKIQANMDPKHRDRIAFIRICSGQFQRDMAVTHIQSGKRVRLSNSHKLFGQDRESVDLAYAGDVVGLVGHAEFGIGDTLTQDSSIVYEEIPRFAPESFRYLHNLNVSQYKGFKQGVEQLLNEQVIQSFQVGKGTQQIPLLAAVGPLQFEVVQYRLQSEYGVESRFEDAPWSFVRWVKPGTAMEAVTGAVLVSGVSFATDMNGFTAILFPNEWTIRYFCEKNPTLELLSLPPAKGKR